MTDKWLFCAMVAFIGVGGGCMLAIMNINILLSGDLEGFPYIITFLVMGIPCAIFALKPWVAYFKARRNYNGEQVVFGVPWE